MATPVASGAAVREEDSPKVARVTKPAAPARERLPALGALPGMTIGRRLLGHNPRTVCAAYPGAGAPRGARPLRRHDHRGDPACQHLGHGERDLPAARARPLARLDPD